MNAQSEMVPIAKSPEVHVCLQSLLEHSTSRRMAKDKRSNVTRSKEEHALDRNGEAHSGTLKKTHDKQCKCLSLCLRCCLERKPRKHNGEAHCERARATEKHAANILALQRRRIRVAEMARDRLC